MALALIVLYDNFRDMKEVYLTEHTQKHQLDFHLT